MYIFGHLVTKMHKNQSIADLWWLISQNNCRIIYCAYTLRWLYSETQLHMNKESLHSIAWTEFFRFNGSPLETI